MVLYAFEVGTRQSCLDLTSLLLKHSWEKCIPILIVFQAQKMFVLLRGRFLGHTCEQVRLPLKNRRKLYNHLFDWIVDLLSCGVLLFEVNTEQSSNNNGRIIAGCSCCCSWCVKRNEML